MQRMQEEDEAVHGSSGDATASGMVFSFRTDGTVPPADARSFTCELQAQQCRATVAGGRRCARMCVLTIPFCRQHLAAHGLRVGRTQLDIGPVNNLGLFAAKRKPTGPALVFRTGDMLLKYEGEPVTRAQLFQRYGKFTAPYCMQVDKTTFLDAACVRSACAMVNAPLAPARANCKFVSWEGGVHLMATKPIRDGDELLVSYGPAYKFREPTIVRTRARRRP
jgi:hypothetical protein